MRRVRRYVLVGVLLALAATATLADGQAVATPTKCSTHGIPPYVKSISEQGTTCAGARTVVHDWFHRIKTPGGNACLVPDGSARPAVCSVGAWRCTMLHTVNGQTYPVTCKTDAGRRRVHFVNQV